MIQAQGFSSTVFGINFPASTSVQFLFLQQSLHIFIYFLTSFITPGYQKFLVTNSIVFHCPPCPLTSILQCSQITSAFSFSSLETYTFLSLNISLFSFHYFSSLNIFTLAHFISSIAFITLLSFASDFLIFSNKSISSITISTTCVTLISNHSFFTNTLFSLSFSISICQSGYLLRLSALPILLSGICLRIKSNLNRYKAHFVRTQTKMSQNYSQFKLTRRSQQSFHLITVYYLYIFCIYLYL